MQILELYRYITDPSPADDNTDYITDDDNDFKNENTDQNTPTLPIHHRPLSYSNTDDNTDDITNDNTDDDTGDNTDANNPTLPVHHTPLSY